METFNELFDEYYLHQLRFWTSLGKQTRAQKGLWNGTLPFGYMTDENGERVPHSKNAQGLRMAFEAYSTGRYSDTQIAELLNQEGYHTTGNWGERPFTKDTINRLLQNVFYLGLTKYKGETFPGQHLPLIGKELFDKCQAVRAGRRKRPRALGRTMRVYVLAGLARCHQCGLTLRCGATQSKGEWRYYRHTAKARGYDCPVPGTYIRADVLEPQWSEIVSSICLPADWQKRIEELAGDTDHRQSTLREREAVQEKLRRLKRLYQDMLIDDAEYRSSLQDLQSRLASLILPDSPHLVKAGEYLENLGSLWVAATLSEQRDISRVILRAIHVDVVNQRIVSIQVQPVFSMLFQELCEEIGVKVL